LTRRCHAQDQQEKNYTLIPRSATCHLEYLGSVLSCEWRGFFASLSDADSGYPERIKMRALRPAFGGEEFSVVGRRTVDVRQKPDAVIDDCVATRG